MKAKPARETIFKNEPALTLFFGNAKRLLPLLILGIFSLALYFIWHLLRQHSYAEIAGSIGSIPTDKLVLAIFVTTICYGLLGCYDVLGFRYAKAKLPLLKIFFGSFTAFAFSNSIGLANLAGTSVRLRIYTAFGVEPLKILKIIVFISASFWLGFLCLSGVIFSIYGLTVPDTIPIPSIFVRWLGVIFLAIVASYLFFTKTRKAPLSFRGHSLELPTVRISVLQVLVAATDWALAGLVLYILLPTSSMISYPAFLAIFLSAQVIALLTHVPGGLGILEVVIIYFLSSDHHPTPAILAALFTYRFIYYLLPLLIAAIGLLSLEAYRRRNQANILYKSMTKWTSPLVPSVMSVFVFIAGLILLISGATPTEASRLHSILQIIPLPAIEVSHFLGSSVGVVLLVLARGLLNRSNAAWFLSIGLLALGAAFSLIKGFDYEEATVLLVFLVVLLSSEKEFYRKANLFTERWSSAWVMAFSMVLLGSIWIGFFMNRHIEYSNELWWTFSLNQDAPRFLRGMFGAFATMILLSVNYFLRPGSKPKQTQTISFELAEPIVKMSVHTVANLALLGDKSLFSNSKNDAFIMYSVQGSTWISLGDPIGNPDSFEDLLLEFKELADHHSGQVVFYQIRADLLPLYIDLGMIFLKLGEEARVDLDKFTLEGGSRKGLRQSYNRFTKAGIGFRIIPPDGFDSIFPVIKNVSDNWLQNKNTKEKGFSIGYFDNKYLKRFSTAILERDSQVVAFANLWEGADKYELSVDLMRYDPGGPHGAMEQLLVEIMLWGKNEGYKYFNLGMVPLSGLETGRSGSRWNRAGQVISQYGEPFYRFKGLRAYKEKFDPIWEPRFLAYSEKLSLPIVLKDITVLISGNVKGLVTK